MILQRNKNPILDSQVVQQCDVDKIASPTVHWRGVQQARRDIRDVRRRESAAEAIAGLDRTTEIFGFTKGQFSLLDLWLAALDIIGPSHLTISTWTAARKEIKTLGDLQSDGKLLGSRWLIDFTFARRDPAAAQAIRNTFGIDSCRVAKNHSKFAIFQNDKWKLVLRTSMNLNMNPRFEDFTIAHDPDLADFLNTIMDEIFSRQKRSLINASSKEISKYFQEKM